jgi:parallel beta-helix repeat protein
MMLVLLVVSSFALTFSGKPVRAQGEEVKAKIINPNSGDREFNLSTTDYPVNSTFTADLYVLNVTGMLSWQIYLSWNNTVIDFSKAWIPDNNVFAEAVSQGAALIAPAPSVEVDGEVGYLLYGAGLLPLTPVNVTTQALLCRINFTVAAVPEDSQLFSDIGMIPYAKDNLTLQSCVILQGPEGLGAHVPISAEPAEVRIIKPEIVAGTTIYIRADGSVDPSTAPMRRTGDTYTLTGNIMSSANGIVVERDNIVVDGAGYAFRGTGGIGVDLSNRSNVTVRNMEISMYNTGTFDSGVFLNCSSGNIVSGDNITADNGVFFSSSCIDNVVSENNVTSDVYGVALWSSSHNNIILENRMINTHYGIAVGSSCSNNSVSGNNITGCGYGIGLWSSSSGNTISGNSITLNSGYGVRLASSSGNSIVGNYIAENHEGISVGSDSCANSVFGNDITDNYYGIYYDYGVYLGPVFGNRFYHNSIMNNTRQVLVEAPSPPGTGGPTDVWDDGYPSGGNHWSDYAGVDVRNGPYQNESGGDGTGDTAYVIDANNKDRYPLMGAFSDLAVTEGCAVQAVSNSTVSDFRFNGTAILFSVSGESGTAGFCRACVPTALLNGTLRVFVNGTEVRYSVLPASDSTRRYLYFTYSHSTEEVVIVPQFPSLLIMSPENRTYNVSSVQLNFTVDVPTSWVGYSLDDEANKTIAGNTTLTLSDGFHSIVVYANSTAGNMGASSKLYFTVDVTPPQIAKVSQYPPGNNVQANQSVTVYVNATDLVSGIKSVTLSYSVGPVWLDFPMPLNHTTGLYTYVLPGRAAGSVVKFKITAYDNAGNSVVDDNAGQYFVYTVTPEFLPLIAAALFVMATLLAVVICRRGIARRKVRSSAIIE